MSTIEITRMEDVQVGDNVTLTRDGLTVTGRVRSEGTAVGLAQWHLYFPGIGTLYDRDGWTLVSATREMPDDTEALRQDLAWCKWAARVHARDAEALRRSLDVAREGYRKEAADWRARDTRMGAEVERLEAEVKRLRDSMDANTNFLISSNGTIWHHDTHCPHRRATPTRKQIVDAMWPDAPESARAGMTHLDTVDRILALYGQDGAS